MLPGDTAGRYATSIRRTLVAIGASGSAVAVGPELGAYGAIAVLIGHARHAGTRGAWRGRRARRMAIGRTAIATGGGLCSATPRPERKTNRGYGHECEERTHGLPHFGGGA
ncbi:hypothetical protein AKJ09_07410 [Labilithrix luteola]|uniref:Uncharacterized protein n=1 Tax=Labilithrix luteola TaxID=1391654 RepID=A0A0K1Q520_9BACT|nr:hypothetical protein AKJ09_07410 [Labilithrix luteola]